MYNFRTTMIWPILLHIHTHIHVHTGVVLMSASMIMGTVTWTTVREETV